MSVLDNTRPASFKGVEFRVSRATTNEGVNRANYLYINTGRRVSKALGNYPADFNIVGFTHALDGDDYEQNRDALRAALSDPAIGTLVHPFLGSFEVVAGKYTFVENFQEVGICRFTIPFFVADKSNDNPGVPVNRQASASTINTLSIEANRELQDASAAAFVNSTVLNQEVSKSLFESAGEAFIETFSEAGDTAQQIADYTEEVLKIVESASFYANNPYLGFAALADSIFGIDGLTNDVFSKYLAVKALFNWGDKDSAYDTEDTSPVRIDPNPRTIEDAERKTNTDIMTNFMQAGNLMESFKQSSAQDFTTIDDINQRIVELDEQFEKVKEALTSLPEQEIYNFDIPSPDYNSTYEALRDLRDETFRLFEQKKLTTARVEIINIQRQPASVLAYTLYGDSTRAEEILSLNNIRDNMILSGDIKVLSV